MTIYHSGNSGGQHIDIDTITQQELDNILGVSYQTISKWEWGQSLPDITLLAELCKALHVSADVLLGLECRSDSVGSDLSMYPQVYSEEVRVIESLETPDNISIFLANR